MDHNIFNFPAINLKLRSPYSFPYLDGLTPAHLSSDNVVGVDAQGNPSVGGMTLQPASTSKVQDGMQAAATFDNGGYGDAISFPVIFTGVGVATLANGDPFVLKRPTNTRLSLLIFNFSVLGNVFYAFDRLADNVSCIAIAAAGNKDFSTKVPQGPLSLFSTGAGRVIIEYMNGNLNT